MPEGIVQWCDPSTGEASVIRKGRRFRAVLAEVEPPARHAGARVHFDIRRDDGVERAVDVRVRRGARVSRTHRNVGTLVGARRADTKGPEPYGQVFPGLKRTAATHPLDVAWAWAWSVTQGDTDAALALYAPDAVIHHEDGQTAGLAAARELVVRNPAFGAGRLARVRGRAGEAQVEWDPAGPDTPGASVRCRIAHEQIVEQWVEAPSAVGSEALTPGGATVPAVVLACTGDVGEEDKQYALERILALTDMTDEPILFARVKLGREPDPARPRRATVQVTLDVNGDPLRAHVAAHTLHEGIDLVQQRMRDQIEHRAEHLSAERKRGEPPVAGEWRHGDQPAQRPQYFPRAVEERQVVRHKTFSVDELTPDEAIFDMEQLDYDFHLFCDLASGLDAVVERLEDGSYRLTRQTPVAVDAGPTATAMEVSTVEIPDLSVDEAVERLDAGTEPFVFFVDPTTGRGNILYRRYDGHYGLISPQ